MQDIDHSHAQKVPLGYKQTEVGMIPEDWEVVALENITTRIGDGLHGTPIYSDNGDYFFINGNNLHGGKIVVTKDTKSVSYSEYVMHRKPLSSRTILLSINGTIGNVAFLNEEELVLGKSAAYLNIASGSSKLFVYYSIQTNIVKRQFLDGMTGSTIGNLGLGTIRNTLIPTPKTKTEQRAIATALSDVDALLDGLDQLLAKKRDLKQATMQQLLTGKTRLPGFEGEWEVKTLGSVCSQVTTGKLDANAMSSNGEYRFYTCAKDFYFIDNYAFDCEALLISGNGANVGYIHYYEGKFNAYQRTYVLSGFLVSIRYIQHYLSQKLAERIEVEVKAGGTPYITRSTITEMFINLPPTNAEQTAIAAVLSDMDAEIAALEQRRAKTRNLKQAMMQELLTGKTRLI